VLIVGATGHRVLAEIPRVAAGIDLALRMITDGWGRLPDSVASALAEGADRLIVVRAQVGGIRGLIVPLPLPVESYLQDFRTDASRREFHRLVARATEVLTPATVGSREEAYGQAARLVVERSTVLIAVWDGQPTETAAGTAATVAMARECGTPVLRVHAANRHPATGLPQSFGSEQGRVTVEGTLG
jgi:hypothetical protein